MKIRQGFVSNSSTSSFVVTGFFLDAKKHTRLGVLTQLYPGEAPPVNPEDPDANEDELDEWVWGASNREGVVVKVASNGDDSLPENTILVGIEVDSESNADAGLQGHWTFQDLESQVETLRLKLGLTKVEYPTELVTGTESC